MTDPHASPPTSHVPPPTRRTFVVFVAAWVTFTVYGSIVPLDYRPLPWSEAVATFHRAMRDRLAIDSRSDALVNVLLGIPLGFGLLGLACLDRRPSPAAIAARGLALLPLCVGLAAAVEFAQVYFPSRTSAGSDVVCQGVGAVLGMAAWVVFGQRLTEHARAVWGGSGLDGGTGRLLVGYLLLLAFVQVLPLDLHPSPKDIYKKLRDKVEFVPFGEFLDADPDAAWGRAARCLQVFGLYVPVGLLAARLPGRWGEVVTVPRVVGLALALAAVMEGLQLWVASRVPSATDVVVGAAGAVAGYAVGRLRPHGLGIGDVLGLGSWWLAGLIVISWQPFPPRINSPPVPFDWVPGMPLEGGNPLFALEEMLTKVVLFGLAGAIIAAFEPEQAPPRRQIVAAGVGLVTSGVFEAGQTVFGSHTPCITDVLLGGLGAWLGAWVARRAAPARNST